MKPFFAVCVAFGLLWSASAPSGASGPDELKGLFALVGRLDAMADATSQEAPPILTQEDLSLWTSEIVPYFAKEGIGDPALPRYPEEVFTNYEENEYFFHVLGTTDLMGNIDLNARYLNPHSARYGSPTELMTLIHELCHAQGIQFGYSAWEEWGLSYNVETSAQLCAWEVAAAMIDSGNKAVYPSLVGELRGRALGAAEYLAIEQDRLPEYEAFVKELLDPWEMAAEARAERVWQDKPDELARILGDYYYGPISLLIGAYNTDHLVEGVMLPINWLPDMINHPYAYSDYGYTMSPKRPETLEPVLPLVADDLCYVLAHPELAS